MALSDDELSRAVHDLKLRTGLIVLAVTAPVFVLVGQSDRDFLIYIAIVVNLLTMTSFWRFRNRVWYWASAALTIAAPALVIFIAVPSFDYDGASLFLASIGYPIYIASFVLFWTAARRFG